VVSPGMSAENLPASLKPIKAYLDQAKARAADPVIAYHCRLYALQEAMAMRANIPKVDMGFILGLMDQCETDKQKLGDLDDAGVLCENYAQALFQKADDADRAGQSTLPVAKDFLAAAQVMEVCKQFGDLPEDLLEKIKYGKWRFVEICKATKERRPPAPPRGVDPPPADDTAPPPPESEAEMPPVAPMPPMPGMPEPADIAAPTPSIAGGLPEYMGLPPPPPSGVPPAPPPIYDAALPQPPSYSALPAAPPTPIPLAPPYAPQPPVVMPQTSYQPSRPQILEALKLSQSAVSSLQFQDADTAVRCLHQALQILTTPTPR